MEQLIQLEKGKAKTSSDKFLFANATSYNLKGDWLNEPPNLEQAFNYSSTVVKEIHERNKGILKHEPYKVEHTNEAVIITHNSPVDTSNYIVFQFKKIK